VTETYTTIPTQDERVMAALSHGGVLIPMWGILVAVLVWLTHKDKSRFVAFQSLQALAFQVLEILIMVLLMGCYLATFMIPFFGMFASMAVNPNAPPPEPLFGAFFLPFMVFPLFFLTMAVFAIYGIIGAIQTLQGKDFRYAVLGRRLEAWMAK
jgi:uncharacterized Tic20 family protein